MPKGVLVVQTNPISAEQEDEYNDWYSNVHVPEITNIEGFTSARRFKVLDEGGTHRYLAIYELEGDDLQVVQKRLGEASASGKMTMKPVLGMDPAPVLGLYEQI